MNQLRPKGNSPIVAELTRGGGRIKNQILAQVLWDASLIPAPGRRRQEGQKFEVILGYTVSVSLAPATRDPV